ncbi:uncharacterized protein [Miscanthus floridulus]|uniref:uncharacterized protein n=1 Tax=Miscanthus floridulus TaxID=154761 RepID=UPI00345816E2
MAEIEDAMGAPATVTTTESEGTTTDEDVHLSPTCICGGAGGAGGGGGGGSIKILCSFGGRIVPRPHDGVLKYVGGETRVLAVPRSICFRELKNKVEDMFKTEVAAIKYQLLSLAEELDVLVSVTCDEDLVHMLDEYDRLEAKCSPTTSPRFRVYVFTPQAAAPLPSAGAAPTVLPSSARYAGLSRLHPHHHHHHHQQHHHFQPEERYVATVPASPDGSPPFSAQTHGAVSAGNSPRANAVGAEPPTVFGFGMQRVRSSPNLSTLDAAAQRLHQHGVDGSIPGYVSGSPRHAGAGPGPLPLQNNFHHYQHQYPPTPVPVPVQHHAGRYDARGYVRVGNYLAPMVPAARPLSRGGPAPHSEMVTPKKSAIVWD